MNQVAVHHQVDEMMNHAKSKSQAVSGEKDGLKKDGKGQRLLAAHEDYALPSSRSHLKKLGQAESDGQQEGMKEECENNHLKGSGAAAQHSPPGA